MERVLKWTQWGRSGLFRCGRAGYKTITGWLKQLGLDAAKELQKQEKPHALYGRTIHDDSGKLSEIRLYCNIYLDDNELDKLAHDHPHETLYVAHK